jgi:hypothetical protein
VDRALREFERSLAYRRIRNAVYNISVCHLVLGRRDLASHFLDWYVENRPEVASDPRVQAVQRAIAESPEDVGTQDRRLLLWESLYDGVEEPMTITAGGSRSREVPDHLDRTLAMIEESFHGTVGNNTTCFLMRVARSKEEYLMHPPSSMGPCQRRAIAQSLIQIYNEVDQRLQSGGAEPTDLTGARCIEWDPDDPLGGDLTSVAPFSMLDTWSAIESEETRRCAPRPSSTPSPRRASRPAGTPTAAITWEVSRLTTDTEARGVEVGDRIMLSGAGSSDPSGSPLSYQWNLCRPSGDCEVLPRPIMGQGDGSRANFTIEEGGPHAVELVVTNRSGRTAGIRTRISTGQELPGRPTDPEDIPEIPQTGPCPEVPPPARWLECAIQEPVNPDRLDRGAHQILRAYRDRRLDPQWLRPGEVCDFAIDGSLEAEDVELRASTRNIVRTIRSLLTYGGGDYNYQSFVSQFIALRNNVRSSAHRLMSAVQRCNIRGSDEQATSRANMILQGWYAEQQRNPRSVYTVVLE